MIEYLIKNKEAIKKRIKEIANNSYNIHEFWNPYEFDNPKNLTFSAGDGSYNHLDYLSFSFYAVGAVGLLHKVGGKIKRVKESYDFYIEHPLDITERLRLYMLILELKLAYYLLKNYNIDYYLFDGSLFSLLISAKTAIEKFGKDDFEKFYDKYKEELDNEIHKSLENDEIVINSKIYNLDREKKVLLEALEYILVLNKIINEFKNKIIGISKTSRINIYFNANIPDIAIFTKYTNDEGYSKPINFFETLAESYGEGYKQLSGVMKSICFIRKFGAKLNNAYIQFVRLERNKAVLGITSFDKIDLKVLSSLKAISIDGYPYVLKKAHNMVKITNKDMRYFAKFLNIEEPIARYMVERL
ncbi:NurA domain protein [Methanocaldococcus villosus KIN24-T80]|uniref:NurA domain protein n=1 Tax=Methanocaldococcus villosus KIN24-T80 TaxID=1069083 RepID=N6UUT1_9EURY|nr:DNA double-strand break repair nuclease NurA [Methanocaldococcus villosus]ENN96099.1 NurA domain protein [Methanocaldococcus villosus KIN24-T80]